MKKLTVNSLHKQLGIFGFSFGAKKETEKGSSSGSKTTATTGTTVLDSLSEEEIESLNTLISTVTGVQSGTVIKGTAQGRDLLNFLGEQIPAIFGEFTDEKARADSQGAVTAAINQILQKGLPDLRTGQTSSGAFNDTTTQTLRDNLVAQAAGVGASVEAEAVQASREIRLGAVDRLLATIKGQQESKIVTTAEDTQETVAEEETVASQSVESSQTETIDVLEQEDVTTQTRGKTTGLSAGLTFGSAGS